MLTFMLRFCYKHIKITIIYRRKVIVKKIKYVKFRFAAKSATCKWNSSEELHEDFKASINKKEVTFL